MSLSKFSTAISSFLIFNVFLCAYAAQDATNSSRNKIHTQANELTTRDQGQSKMHIEMTRAIRQKVVAEQSISNTAKNVKIITNAGGVTLKGPVQTQSEKDRIFEIAVNIAGKNRVNNELEVINK